MKIRRCIGTCLAFFGATAAAQDVSDFVVTETYLPDSGWTGFTDTEFLINSALTLVLAAVLGAIIAYHPRHRQTADTLEEIEAPKVFITYAIIGAIIGVLVVKYGTIVGFVLFGIGGLIRFRTVLGSPSLTGNVILVTLIGLSCGLDLPHVAVLSTIFGFIVIYILEARFTYRITVRALSGEHVSESASAYRDTLEKLGFNILSERKSPRRGRVTFIFRSSRSVSQFEFEDLINAQIEPGLQGALDWEIN